MKSLIQDNKKWEEYKRTHKLSSADHRTKEEHTRLKHSEELRQIQKDIKNKMNISQQKEYRRKYYQMHKEKWNRASKEERDKEREYNPTYIELEGINVSDAIMETIRQNYVKSVKDKCVFDTYNILQASQVLCLKCKGCDIKQEDAYGIKWRLNEEDDKKIGQILWCRQTECPIWSFRIFSDNKIYMDGDIKWNKSESIKENLKNSTE